MARTTTRLARENHGLVVVVPAFNEEATLGQTLQRIRRCALPGEVVVVDDGSSDRTSDVAASAGVRVLRHPFNLGYGAALQTGYKVALEARACAIVQIDADGQHDPRDIGRLVAGILDQSADIVIGSRFLKGHGYQMNRVHRLARRLFCAVARWNGLHLTDPTSGFQALSPGVARSFCSDFPTDYPDLDVLLAAHRRGFRIQEVAVQMAASPRPSTLHGGFSSLYYMLRTLLSLGTLPGRRRTTTPPVASTEEEPEP